MAIQNVLPLLNFGMELVDKYYLNDKDKLATKEKLLQLDAEGKTKELEAEVKKIKDITSVDTVIDKEAVPIFKSDEDKNHWKDKLANLIMYASGFNLLGLPIINQIIGVYNAHIANVAIPPMPGMSMEEMAYALSVLAGAGGVSIWQKSIEAKAKK